MKNRMTLSICICTVNRPAVLERCLESIYGGSMLPTAVLVSDDSPDPGRNRDICSRFPMVSYCEGPRRGLCANRNFVIAQATTDFVSLLDDDAVMGQDFVARSFPLLRELDKKTLVTGDVVDYGRLVIPRNPSFLGFFERLPEGRNETINLNSNLLPRAAFDQVQFDEEIAYGYEDMDLCSHLLSLGYEIRYEPNLMNEHFPPPLTDEQTRARRIKSERARFHTSVKRYFRWERNWTKGGAYLLVAPLHRAAHALKVRDFQDIRHCIPDMAFAIRRLRAARN